MYWLLLPLEANAERHPADKARLSSGFWIRLWVGLQAWITGAKSPAR